jgi:signal recognition particle receptor subunit beta
MVLFNYASKEITSKIVYYGPGLGGKTTNLQFIHEQMNPDTRGKLLSLATETDRTLFFDFLPVNLGKIRGFTVRFQLYTVPGQVYYNATRKLVLKGADALVFVADSQSEMLEKNLESLENMKENLIIDDLDPETIPLVIQYNKRDLPDIMAVDELHRHLRCRDVPFNEAVALTGEGVLETFKLVTKELMKTLRVKHDIGGLQGMGEEKNQPPAFSKAPQPSLNQDASDGVQTSDGKEEVLSSSENATPPRLETDAAYQLAETVQEIQAQIQKIEKQLSILLSKDDVIQDLLQQIKNKLEAEEQEKPLLVEAIEEPIIPEEKKRRKKRFFWNR